MTVVTIESLIDRFTLGVYRNVTVVSVACKGRNERRRDEVVLFNFILAWDSSNCTAFSITRIRDPHSRRRMAVCTVHSILYILVRGQQTLC